MIIMWNNTYVEQYICGTIHMWNNTYYVQQLILLLTKLILFTLFP